MIVHGGLTMRKHTHLILSLLVPAFLVLGGYAALKAQQKTSSTASGKRWSDAATWPDKKVPAKDALVTIGRDMDVVLDVTPPALHGLTINGKLSFADNKDLELTTEWIMVHGELEIGTEAKPHTRKATITLTDNVKGEDISGVGGTTDRVDRGIMLMGGTLNLHGDRNNSWTKLSSTAERRRHLDPGPERCRLARRRRDRSRIHGFRSPAGRTAQHCGHQRKHDHARQEARLHALRQDHLRRG